MLVVLKKGGGGWRLLSQIDYIEYILLYFESLQGQCAIVFHNTFIFSALGYERKKSLIWSNHFVKTIRLILNTLNTETGSNDLKDFSGNFPRPRNRMYLM